MSDDRKEFDLIRDEFRLGLISGINFDLDVDRPALLADMISLSSSAEIYTMLRYLIDREDALCISEMLVDVCFDHVDADDGIPVDLSWRKIDVSGRGFA